MPKILSFSLSSVVTENRKENIGILKHGESLILKIKVLDSDSKVMNLAGKTVKLILKKQDATIYEKTITDISDTQETTLGKMPVAYTGSLLTALLDEQGTNVVGTVKGEILITDELGTIITNTFTLLVIPSLSDSVVVVSSNEIQTLTEMLSVINEYTELSTAIAGTITPLEALESITTYINTNLPALESNNASAVTNNTNLQNSITQSQTSKAALDASIVDANTFVSTHGDIIELDNRTTANENSIDSINTSLLETANSEDYNFKKSVNLTTIYDSNSSQITYSGTWTNNTDPYFYSESYKVSNITNNYIEFTFDGVGISVYDSVNTTRGIVEVFIDGVSQGIYDRYASAIDYRQKFFTISGLTDGSHTIKIVITGTKNASSTDYKFIFDYFEVMTSNNKTLAERVVAKSGIPSVIIVAANNSSVEDKLKADYICDGINDEVEIQNAMDYFNYTSGKVILCNGDYYIDSLRDSGNTNVGKFGVVVHNPNIQRELIIEGSNAPLRRMTGANLSIAVSPVIHLSKTVYDSLTDTELVTIIGVQPSDFANLNRAYPAISLIVNNLGILIPNNKKSIILLDAYYASTFKCDSIIGSIDIPQASAVNPNTNFIGIRGVMGWNFGEGYMISNCFIYGAGIAYNMSGEHLIMSNCGCRYCKYPYAFGLFGILSQNAHPITLINCCHESCEHGILFGDNPNGQNINLIDYNMEAGGAGATENIIGAFKGTITYTMTTSNYNNVDNIPFWEDGYGKSFKTINTHQPLQGTTAERPIAPNLYQQYYDTTLGKVIMPKTLGTKEVDTLTITNPATSSGNITVTLNGAPLTFAVEAGDSVETIGDKIRKITAIPYSWVKGGTAGTAVVTFTKVSLTSASAPVFSGGTTGVTGTFSVKAITNCTWMDYTGNTV